jgi:hypothetical protein
MLTCTLQPLDLRNPGRSDRRREAMKLGPSDVMELSGRCRMSARAFSSEWTPVRVKKTRQNKTPELLVLIQSEPKML